MRVYVDNIDIGFTDFSADEITLLHKLVHQPTGGDDRQRWQAVPLRAPRDRQLAFPGVAALWLDPAGLDIDLETPLAGE